MGSVPVSGGSYALSEAHKDVSPGSLSNPNAAVHRREKPA